MIALLARLLCRPTPNGITCVRCGRYYGIAPARPAWRTPAYACTPNCTLDVTDDVADLFADRVPGAWLWHLGSDDRDRLTPGQIAGIDAQPRWTVTLYDTPGAAPLLTTRPLPEQYAFAIVAQAGRLGFTALPVHYAPEAAVAA